LDGQKGGRELSDVSGLRQPIAFHLDAPLKGLVTFKSVYMVSNLIKTRSLSMVKVHQQKPGERDRDGTRNTYNTSISSCNR
jgi:hypothetical protein